MHTFWWPLCMQTERKSFLLYTSWWWWPFKGCILITWEKSKMYVYVYVISRARNWIRWKFGWYTEQLLETNLVCVCVCSSYLRNSQFDKKKTYEIILYKPIFFFNFAEIFRFSLTIASGQAVYAWSAWRLCLTGIYDSKNPRSTATLTNSFKKGKYTDTHNISAAKNTFRRYYYFSVNCTSIKQHSQDRFHPLRSKPTEKQTEKLKKRK